MFKKILIGFFASLGVIFFCILVGLAYLIIADPFNLRPMVSLLLQTQAEQSESSGGTIIKDELRGVPVPTGESNISVESATNISVTSEQSKAMESVGLSPNSISADQEACFVGILGQARVDEVKAGAVPSASEFFSARECL